MDNNKFDIKVKEDHGDTYLSITHDGNQWTSIRITGKIPHLIEVLELHLTKQSSGRENRGSDSPIAGSRRNAL